MTVHLESWQWPMPSQVRSFWRQHGTVAVAQQLPSAPPGGVFGHSVQTVVVLVVGLILHGWPLATNLQLTQQPSYTSFLFLSKHLVTPPVVVQSQSSLHAVSTLPLPHWQGGGQVAGQGGTDPAPPQKPQSFTGVQRGSGERVIIPRSVSALDGADASNKPPLLVRSSRMPPVSPPSTDKRGMGTPSSAPSCFNCFTINKQITNGNEDCYRLAAPLPCGAVAERVGSVGV